MWFARLELTFLYLILILIWPSFNQLQWKIAKTSKDPVVPLLFNIFFRECQTEKRSLTLEITID